MEKGEGGGRHAAEATIARLINNNNCNYRCNHCNILRQVIFVSFGARATFSCMMASCVRIVAALLLIVN